MGERALEGERKRDLLERVINNPKLNQKHQLADFCRIYIKSHGIIVVALESVFLNCPYPKCVPRPNEEEIPPHFNPTPDRHHFRPCKQIRSHGNIREWYELKLKQITPDLKEQRKLTQLEPRTNQPSTIIPCVSRLAMCVVS